MDSFDNKDLVVRPHKIFCKEICMCVASKKLNYRMDGIIKYQMNVLECIFLLFLPFILLFPLLLIL